MKGLLQLALRAWFLLALSHGLAAAQSTATPSTASQATANQAVKVSSTNVSGGKVGPATITKATAASDVTLKGKNGTPDLPVKAGDSIQNLAIDSATIKKGTISGGNWTAPAKITVEREDATIKNQTVSDTSLNGVALEKAVISKGKRKFQHKGKDVEGDFEGSTIDLDGAVAAKVNVSGTDLPATLAAKPSEKPAQTAEAQNIPLIGDYFFITSQLEGFSLAKGASDNITAPHQACLRVVEEVEKPDPEDAGKKIKYARIVFVPKGEDNWTHKLLPPYRCLSAAQLGSAINPQLRYDIRSDDLLNADRVRYGWTYGILVAPFKYYTATREFSAGATVGPYLGYRFDDRPGTSAVAAFAIGATAANVKQDDGESKISNGLSAAFAYLIEFKRDFNVSFLYGMDFFSEKDKVPNSGRIWLGISFGRKLE